MFVKTYFTPFYFTTRYFESSTSVINGSASVSCVSGITSVAKVIHNAVVSINAVVNVTEVAKVVHNAVGSINAVVNVTEVAKVVHNAVGSINAVVNVTEVAKVVHNAVGSINAVINVTEVAKVVRNSEATVQAVVNVTEVSKVVHNAVGPINAVVNVTEVAKVVYDAVGSINAIVNVTEVAKVFYDSVGFINSVVNVTEVAKVVHNAEATVQAVDVTNVICSVKHNSSVNILGIITLSATSIIINISCGIHVVSTFGQKGLVVHHATVAELCSSSLNIVSSIGYSGKADIAVASIGSFEASVYRSGKGVLKAVTTVAAMSAYNFNASGGVIIGGHADVVVNYFYIASGGVVLISNAANSTLAGSYFSIFYNFPWQSDAFIQINTNFGWNVGKLDSYWYRIVGKGKAGACPPVDVHDPCCQKFIVNIQARSIDELCNKLKERRWQWPIQSVQRFSLPAENKVLRAGVEAGLLDPTCNDTVPVHICTNALCTDFCVSEAPVEQLGMVVTAQIITIRSYTGSTSRSGPSPQGPGHGGSVLLRGSAQVSFIKNTYVISYVGSGGVVLSGKAGLQSSCYHFTGTGGVVLAGQVVLQSSNYNFIGGVWPFDTGVKTPNASYQFIESPSDVPWLYTNNIFQNDGVYSVADVSYLRNSGFLVAKGFGFSVPNGMNVRGIQATVTRHAAGPVQDVEVYLVVGQQIVSNNLAKIGINWPVAVDSTVIYGGNDANVADINNPQFGLAIRVKGLNNVSGVVAYVNNVNLEVLYETITGQTVRISGSAGLKSTNWKYVSVGGMRLGGSAGLYTIYMMVANQVFPSVKLRGSYVRYCKHTSTGGVKLDGAAQVKCSYYSYTDKGGVKLGGQAGIISSSFYYSGSGKVKLIGKADNEFVYVYRPSGGVILGGDYNRDFSHEGIGGVKLGGQAVIISSSFSYVGSGKVVIGGTLVTNFTSFGTLVTFMGGSTMTTDLLGLYGTDANLTSTLVPSAATLTKCNCSSMPLTLPFSHNIITNNKLSQFVSRNNIGLANISNLNYNSINGSWQANFHYRGFSPDNLGQEDWTLLFDLQCTNVIGGIDIGENVWKWSTMVSVRNLTTFEFFSTRVIIGFLPGKVCGPDDLFKVNIGFDVVHNFVNISPDATIYQFLLHDDIGLFKTAFWLSRPNLLFAISQESLSNNASRYRLNIS